MQQTKKPPKGIRPYLMHRVEVEYIPGEEQAAGECPFCNRDRFVVNVENGLASCHHGCCEGLNPTSFLQRLWEASYSHTSDYQELSESRGIEPSTFAEWGVCRSILTGEWLVPAYSLKGSLLQLYLWRKYQDGMRLLATSGVDHCLIGIPLFNPRVPVVYLCEGPWDGMALWEALLNTKQAGDRLLTTANRAQSLLSGASVLAVPGATTWKAPWSNLLRGKHVRICFDNDHPRPDPSNPSRRILGSGLSGTRRLSRKVRGIGSIEYLRWGVEGYSEELPSGFDVRDILRLGGREAVNGAVGSPIARLAGLRELIGNLAPIPEEWLRGRARAVSGGGSNGDGKPKDLSPKRCEGYGELVKAWRRAFRWMPGLDRALSVMLATVASTPIVGDQLWVKIIGPPACGKTALCEAISTAKDHVIAKSTIRGFHSGFKVDGSDDEDHSLVALMHGKTLVTKDGDTLLQSPELPRILAEARDLYDGTARTHYRNKMSRAYDNVRMTWILSGTKSLRSIDRSELGERFLDCVIMEGIDEELEEEISRRKAHQAWRNLGVQSIEGACGQYPDEQIEAMRLTGGYVNWLRENATDLIGHVEASEETIGYCTRLAKFISMMRARPAMYSESADREMSTRLSSQLVRLAGCLTIVLNENNLAGEALVRTRQVAIDTSRGEVLAIVAYLYDREGGLLTRTLATYLAKTEKEVENTLRFMRGVGIIQRGKDEKKGVNYQPRWRLTREARKLYEEVMINRSS